MMKITAKLLSNNDISKCVCIKAILRRSEMPNATPIFANVALYKQGIPLLRLLVKKIEVVTTDWIIPEKIIFIRVGISEKGVLNIVQNVIIIKDERMKTPQLNA